MSILTFCLDNKINSLHTNLKTEVTGFWQSTYHDVKKYMKGRYPKHYWPENPLEAQATAKIKRKNKPGR